LAIAASILDDTAVFNTTHLPHYQKILTRSQLEDITESECFVLFSLLITHVKKDFVILYLLNSTFGFRFLYCVTSQSARSIPNSLPVKIFHSLLQSNKLSIKIEDSIHFSVVMIKLRRDFLGSSETISIRIISYDD
jgi:hypothetical protein